MKNILLYLLCIVSFPLSSQIFSFRTFTEDDGLSQSFINDINQDNRGFLYMATGNGLTCYGGTKFIVMTSKDGLANDFVTTIYNDHENKTWLGHLEGGITVLHNDGRIEAVKLNEEISPKIIQILEIATNKYIFLKGNEGIIIYDEGTKSSINLKEDAFYEVLKVLILKDELLLLKPDGIYSLKTKAFLAKNYALTKRMSLQDGARMQLNIAGDNLIVLDNLLGVLTFKTDNKLNPIDTFKVSKTDGTYFTKLVPDRFSNIYVSTSDNGVYKINTQTRSIFNYTIKNGLASNAVQSVFLDREDNLWIGTYGNGLQQLTNEIFSYNAISELGQKIAVHASLKIHGKTVLGSNKGIGYFSNDKIDFVTNPLVKNKIINGLIYYRNNFVFSSTDGELFYSDTIFKKITKINLKTVNQKLTINSLTSNADNLLVCTTSGLYVINPIDYSYNLLNTESGLLHNNVKFVFCDTKKRVWVCSPGTLIYYLDDFKDIKRFNEIKGMKNFHTNGVCEDADNNIWISSAGDGVFKYNGRTFENFTVANGLKSNFCIGITTDYKKGIWVSHSNGISYKNVNKKNFNKVGGNTELLQTQFIENSLYYDKSENDIVFGTVDGFARINTVKQHFNEVEPRLNFLRVTLNDVSLPLYKDTVLSYNSYDLNIDFIGISLLDPTKVKYKFKLEGLTDNFEELGYETRKRNYPKLQDGEYTFILYSANNDGLWNSNPIKFKITIKKPFWKEYLFYVLLLVVLITIFVFLIRKRTQNLIRKQKVLQEIIEQKTIEISNEKELIAKVNENLNVVLKDLKDSINYAKKIQAYILPDLQHVQKNLKTFLYFQPKDVVSGDYYGFYNVSKDKTIVFVIDCTGHGVPGAFLTVISKAFMNKIIIDKEIHEPDAIIENLNMELRGFFTTNFEGEAKSYEGLVMSVCVIDYPSKTVECCGAGRPFLYKIENELILQRGNVYSVGYDEDLPALEVLKIPFNKGLRMYLHSDGIQDQFGGLKMKKYSSKRIFDALNKQKDLSFEKECEILINDFLAWKDVTPQVDDVCFFAFELFSGS
jgi:ligand-binding sensor domain-containing protein/serine phosphatase RsbU (regulator of sigma subunit)